LTEEEKQLLIKKFEEEYEKRKQDVIEYRSLLTKLKRNENNLRNELYQFKNPNLNFIHSDCEGLPPDLFQQKNLSSLKYISPSTVFANKEVNMNKIDTYGFDYDVSFYFNIIKNTIIESNRLLNIFYFPLFIYIYIYFHY